MTKVGEKKMLSNTYLNKLNALIATVGLETILMEVLTDLPSYKAEELIDAVANRHNADVEDDEAYRVDVEYGEEYVEGDFYTPSRDGAEDYACIVRKKGHTALVFEKDTTGKYRRIL